MPTPRRFSTLATFVALSFALAPWPGAAGAGSPDRSGDHRAAALDQAVAYQNDSFHDGANPASPLEPPLVRKWSVNLSGSISYPLIAGGKIFVTVANTGPYGTTLYALDETDGHVVWSTPITGTYYWSNAAYDGGTVFVVNFDGLLRAFDANDGTKRWEVQLPGQYAFSSPPVAVGGVVYTGGAGSGGTVYAVRETDGFVLWTAGVANGNNSSPAVTASFVYVSYACPNVYAFKRATGELAWESVACSGGGGRTPVIHDDRLYVRDFVTSPPGYTFDGTTGGLLGRFSATPAPAFGGNVGFFL